MNLNEKLRIDINLEKSNNDNNILELNNKISIKNRINDNNINQSNGSIKTTEYSSKSSEFISKYIISKYKNNHHYKNNKDKFKDNINKNIQINNNTKGENIKNKKTKHTKKHSKAPKFVGYNNDFLDKNKTNINAPKLPINYNIEFLVDNFTKQSEIGEKNFVKKKDIDTYNKNEDYKKIARMPHDKLSHLAINKNLFLNKDDKNYNKISVTQRVKHKFLTIIYISPNSTKNLLINKKILSENNN